jgi:hypothetical protein
VQTIHKADNQWYAELLPQEEIQYVDAGDYYSADVSVSVPVFFSQTIGMKSGDIVEMSVNMRKVA